MWAHIKSDSMNCHPVTGLIGWVLSTVLLLSVGEGKAAQDTKPATTTLTLAWLFFASVAGKSPARKPLPG